MEIKCDICGKTGFKSKSGLAGHMKIAHGADTRKTVPDEIGKRLKALEEGQDLLVEASMRLIDNDNRLLEAIEENLKKFMKLSVKQ